MKLKYIALSAALGLMALSSCNDFLDKVPDTRVDLQNVEQLRQLLITGYLDVNYAATGELSSDNMVDNQAPDEEGNRYNLTSYALPDEQLFKWEDVNTGTDNETPSGIWSGCYGAIACANAVLEKADEMEANGKLSGTDLEKLRAVEGEAYLIRAYHHFVLASFFCMPWRGDELSAQYQGIPYITKPETTVKPHYERGTLLETYKNIEADLLKGLPLINDSYYEIPKTHFNKSAANAFACRFYLTKRDYEKVLEYANAAFNGSDPSQLMSDLWSQSNFYYIKDINRYATSTQRPGNWLQLSTYSTWWRRYRGYRFACNREARRATIQGPGPSWENCRYRNTRTNQTFSMNPCFASVCGTSGEAEYGSYFAGNCGEQFEYTDKLAGIGYCHVVRHEFWAEETLLARAEAKLFMGDTEGCVADLKIWDDARQNNIAGNSNMVPLTAKLIEKFYTTKGGGDEFGIMKTIHIDEVCPTAKYHLTEAMMPYMQCIQHYRRIETVHTGLRWLDIKRLGLSITHYFGRFNQKYTLKTLDDRYAIQIPSEVRMAGLEPNVRIPADSTSAYATNDAKFIVPVK